MAARRKGQDPKEAPVIALITPNKTPDYWKERYHIRRFIEGCSVTARSLGIQTELFWIGEEKMTAKRKNEILYNRGIRGAVLLSHGTWGKRMDYAWQHLATVTYGARSLDPDTDWIGADFYGNMELALQTLLKYGFKRIGFTMDKPFHYQHHNRWLAAYIMEQSRKHIVRLKRLGSKVPGEVGVEATGTAEVGGETSGIEENTQACGKLGMEMLIGRIHRGEFGPYKAPQHVIVKGSWNEGKTLRPV